MNDVSGWIIVNVGTLRYVHLALVSAINDRVKVIKMQGLNSHSKLPSNFFLCNMYKKQNKQIT